MNTNDKVHSFTDSQGAHFITLLSIYVVRRKFPFLELIFVLLDRLMEIKYERWLFLKKININSESGVFPVFQFR